MKKILIFVAAFCCLTAAVAVEQMALDINFSRPDWKAVVKTLWGAGPQVAGDALEFGPGSFAALPLIPCLPGSTVRIEFDAETTDIEPADAAWRTAAVQLGLFSGDKEQAHLDLFNTGKATARHRVSHSIPLKNSGFRLCFGNYGRTGKFRIANLKVALDVPGRNLERDGSFSGMFGINDWFVRKGGKDWDGLSLGRYDTVPKRSAERYSNRPIRAAGPTSRRICRSIRSIAVCGSETCCRCRDAPESPSSAS